MTDIFATSRLPGALCLCVFVLFSAPSLRAQQPLENTPSEAAVIPLPERNPARVMPSLPPHPSQVDVPEWSAQEIQAARDQCAMMLDGTGTVYSHIEALREGRCGTPAPIELSAIGSNPPVAIEPPARVTCELAASLGAWSDTVLQGAAQKHLGAVIRSIRNVASYVCRNRYNSTDKPISEHARANALDMAAFRTETGEWITVLENWALPPEQPQENESTADGQDSGVTQSVPEATLANTPSRQSDGLHTPSEQPDQGETPKREPEPKPEILFLREIHAGACALFGTVLGPEANDAHKDHFHYDLAERRHSNFCE